MPAGKGGVRHILVNALKDLHAASNDPADDQWFTRQQIARQLKAPSGSLNPTRKNALKKLANEKILREREKPNDGRKPLQYQLIDPNINVTTV